MKIFSLLNIIFILSLFLEVQAMDRTKNFDQSSASLVEMSKKSFESIVCDPSVQINLNLPQLGVPIEENGVTMFHGSFRPECATLNKDVYDKSHPRWNSECLLMTFTYDLYGPGETVCPHRASMILSAEQIRKGLLNFEQGKKQLSLSPSCMQLIEINDPDIFGREIENARKIPRKQKEESAVQKQLREDFISLIYNEKVKINLQLPQLGVDIQHLSQYGEGVATKSHGSFKVGFNELNKVVYDNAHQGSLTNPTWEGLNLTMTFPYDEGKWSYLCHAIILLSEYEIRRGLEQFKEGVTEFTLYPECKKLKTMLSQQ